jgi:hypothetical protein
LLDFIGNNATGWPSYKRLATETGLSLSSVKRCLKTLQTKGFLKVENRFRRDGSRTSNLYRWIDPSEHLSPGHVEPPPVQHGPSILETSNEESKRHDEAAAVPLCRSNSDEDQDRSSRSRANRTRHVVFEADPVRFKSFETIAKSHQMAVDAGLINSGPIDRLRFWSLCAAISRKIKAGKVKCPARLLNYLIRRDRMAAEYVSAEDEDRARLALRKWDLGELLQ